MTKKSKVLVTGASRGIGRGTCEHLDAGGYELVGIARTRPDDWPQHMPFFTADLFDRDEVVRVLQDVQESGAFYGLVNNCAHRAAGRCRPCGTPARHCTECRNKYFVYAGAGAWHGQTRPETCHQYRLARGAGQASSNLVQHDEGGRYRLNPYLGTGTGSQGHYRQYGCARPETEFFQQVNAADNAATCNLREGISVRRIGQPQDVAHAVAYFMDPRCGYVTGQTHYVCGGITTGVT